MLVWLSPQTIGLAGLRESELRTDDVHDAALRVAQREQLDAELRRSSSPARAPGVAAESMVIGAPPNTWLGERRGRVIHGRERAIGRRTGSPRARSTEKACGEVTSWIRCRSTYRTAGVSALSAGDLVAVARPSRTAFAARVTIERCRARSRPGRDRDGAGFAAAMST